MHTFKYSLKFIIQKDLLSKVRQREDKISIIMYFLSEVLTIGADLCTVCIGGDRLRSTCYSGVCTNPGTYYQGWFMYMRYAQGQNEECLLTRSMY